MRIKILLIVLSFYSICNGQQDERISQVTFVQILNNNKEEAIFYYQNNWGVLAEMGIKKGLAESYQILETPYSEEEPFHLILIVTFFNKDQYDNRHGEHFQELLKEKGPDKLMNDKKPAEFCKVLFKKEMVKHLH
jgi:hypothetical protein